MKRDITDEIDKKRAELKELEAELKNFESLPEECKLADVIHEEMCTHNHTDGCGWHYESWEEGLKGKGWSKTQYIKKARKMLKIVDYATAVKVVKALRD
jgi:hypothetical protein